MILNKPYNVQKWQHNSVFIFACEETLGMRRLCLKKCFFNDKIQSIKVSHYLNRPRWSLFRGPLRYHNRQRNPKMLVVITGSSLANYEMGKILLENSSVIVLPSEFLHPKFAKNLILISFKQDTRCIKKCYRIMKVFTFRTFSGNWNEAGICVPISPSFYKQLFCQLHSDKY